ncbi:MAG: hypothetical protein EKK29_09510 [Hyphomicrobiales bacterium]|nr:MAG: hypothetical protein EKK29_09510 [Hyphomicrobiales bacterium]
MMATTINQAEARPASYPAKPIDLTLPAAALDAAMIWQRIEAYIAYRYTPRAVVWIVEGCGEWFPPLAPATISATEVWSQAAVWETAILDAAPLGGFYLPATGPYRFTASVGAGDVPAAVAEAFRRLAEHLAAVKSNVMPGVREEHVDGIGSSIFDAAAVAKALQNSGAADLLRSYRRV